MINKLKYIFIAVSLIAISCNDSSKKDSEITEANNVEKHDIEKISDMSIYNLPSHWTTQDGNEIELKELHGKVLAPCLNRLLAIHQTLPRNIAKATPANNT